MIKFLTIYWELHIQYGISILELEYDNVHTSLLMFHYDRFGKRLRIDILFIKVNLFH